MKTETRTGDISEVVIDARADLMVEGHDNDEVVAVTDSDDQLNVTQDGSRVVIFSRSDCTVRVPVWSQVFIERVGGDCSIRNIDNSVKIRGVGGDLSVLDCGDVSVDSVGGDFSSAGLKGQLQVRAVGGDLNASEAHFSGASLNVGGDATLGLDLEEGQTASINAGGDVKVELLGEPNASVSIMDSGGRRRKVFGAGSANINVRCGGDAVVVAEDAGDDQGKEGKQGDFNFKFGFDNGQFETAMDEFERNLADMERNIEQMAQQFASRFENIGASAGMDWKIQKAQMKAESAARKAEAKMNRHAAKMEEHARRQAERAARYAERATRHAGHAGHPFSGTPVPPTPPQPPSEPFAPPQKRSATDEERMVILRMLQEKKITSEQADQLLAALG